MDVSFYDGFGNSASYFYQWDVNQLIVLDNISLSPTHELHFSNKYHKETICVLPTICNGKLVAWIPNSLLEEAATLHIHICHRSASGSRRTIGMVSITVRPRVKPDVIFGKWVSELFGLSTDEKPVTSIPNGSIFVEIDTGSVYFFNEEATSWVFQFML